MMALLTPDDYLQFPRAEPQFRYAYGDDPQQFGELTLPKSDPPHPVIVLIHGGCYRSIYNLRPMSGVAAALAETGFAVWNIEYRRHGNGGDFPQMFRDVGQAADFLRQVAAAHELDLTRVISIGHSAGGHLALWLAARSSIEHSSPLQVAAPQPIKAVLALAPLADIRSAYGVGMCGEALRSVMGGSPDAVPAHYRNGSPSEMLPLKLPHVHIVGEEDRGILENTRPFVERAQELGDEARLITLPGAGHFEVVSVTSSAWIHVMEAAMRLHERLNSVCGKS